MTLALALLLTARAQETAAEPADRPSEPAAEPADLPEVWVGGGISGGIATSQSGGFTSADATTTQAEVDGAIGWGWGHARVDLDLHFDPTLGVDGIGAYPSPWPEWAMVQLGREKNHLRLGIFNPDIGLEDWDPWVNYAPTYSTNFVYAGAGRFLGGEVSLTTDGAVDVFAFGGYDVDWESFGGGVGIATSQDAFATWSGVFVYPEFAYDCPVSPTIEFTGPGIVPDKCVYAGAALALEIYPASFLTIDIDTVTGYRDSGKAFPKSRGLFTSEQLVLNVIPEAVVNPFLRGELVIDDNDVLPGPDATASVGATSDMTDWLRMALEGKAMFAGGATDLGGALVISAHVPEPSPYSYQDPFGRE